VQGWHRQGLVLASVRTIKHVLPGLCSESLFEIAWESADILSAFSRDTDRFRYDFLFREWHPQQELLFLSIKRDDQPEIPAILRPRSVKPAPLSTP
jgi:hypothetical protein